MLVYNQSFVNVCAKSTIWLVSKNSCWTLRNCVNTGSLFYLPAVVCHLVSACLYCI